MWRLSGCLVSKWRGAAIILRLHGGKFEESLLSGCSLRLVFIVKALMSDFVRRLIGLM